MKAFIALAVIAFVGASLVEGRAVRDLKSTLITRGNELVKKADEAVRKLEAAHQTHEVTVVKHEEAVIKKLIASIEAETDHTKLTHLEHELVMAEVRLHFELAKIEHHGHHSHAPHTAAPTTQATLVKRDLKSTLVTKGQALLKRADEDIKKLQAANRTHAVTVIQHEEAVIKKLLAEVEAETDATKLKHLEHQLQQAEHKLHSELQKIEHEHHQHHSHAPHSTHVTHPHTHPTTVSPSPSTPATLVKRDLKSNLLAKAQTLVKRADEEIKKLEAAKRTHEVTVVKHEEAAIQKLAKQVEAETDHSKLIHLEHQLAQAEHRLQFELMKLEHEHQHHSHAPHTQAPTTTAAF